MKRLLVLLCMAVAAIGLAGGSAARADSYCFSSGLTIMGEPWLSHEQCLPCPTVDCPWIP